MKIIDFGVSSSYMRWRVHRKIGETSIQVTNWQRTLFGWCGGDGDHEADNKMSYNGHRAASV